METARRTNWKRHMEILLGVIAGLAGVFAIVGGVYTFYRWVTESPESGDTASVPTSEDGIADNDKNLFTLGYYHGAIASRIICPFPRETASLGQTVHFALKGLLDEIQYRSTTEYLAQLTNLLRQADDAGSAKETGIVVSRMSESLLPLRKYIEGRYQGRGHASFILGMNLPQLSRCITIFKVIDEAKAKGEVKQTELAEQLWRDVKDMLYGIHIDNLRNLVLLGDLPSDLKRSVNLILSSDIRHDWREMQKQLAKIGAFYDAPVVSGN